MRRTQLVKRGTLWQQRSWEECSLLRERVAMRTLQWRKGKRRRGYSHPSYLVIATQIGSVGVGMVTRATVSQSNDGTNNKRESKIMLQLRMERNIKLQIRRQVERTVVVLTRLRPAQLFSLFSVVNGDRWRTLVLQCAFLESSRRAYRPDKCSVRPTSQHLFTTAPLCFP